MLGHVISSRVSEFKRGDRLVLSDLIVLINSVLSGVYNRLMLDCMVLSLIHDATQPERVQWLSSYSDLLVLNFLLCLLAVERSVLFLVTLIPYRTFYSVLGRWDLSSCLHTSFEVWLFINVGAIIWVSS